MSVDPVTTRWAGALFQLARRRGALDDVRRDVERIGRELRSAAVRQFLFGVAQPLEERRRKLAPLLSSLHPLTANFVNLLLDRRREEVLLGLSEAFKHRLLEERGAVEGRVEAARPLDPADVARIAQSVGKLLGKELLLTAEVDPDLVSGVRVYAGSRMLDYSVAGRLEGLRRRMLDAPLPSATA